MKKLKSSDNVVKEVDVKLLEKSRLLKCLIEDYQGDNDEIYLNEVDSKSLDLIIKYLDHYRNIEQKESHKPNPEGIDNAFNQDLLNDDWTFNYLQAIPLEDLINVVNAANYLQIDELVNVINAKLSHEF